MNTYKILILQNSGKYTEEEHRATTPEMLVRSIMCWYSAGTRFIVTAEDGTTENYIITATHDPISGYTALQRIA